MKAQPAEHQPQSVFVAVNMLWASWSIGLAVLTAYLLKPHEGFETLILLSYLIFGFPVLGFINFKISARRNWARIFALVVFIPGLPSWLFLFFYVPDWLSSLSVDGLLFLTQFGLQTSALFLLFTRSANSWFREVVVA